MFHRVLGRRMATFLSLRALSDQRIEAGLSASKRRFAQVLLGGMLLQGAAQADYIQYPQTQALMDELVSEQGFSRSDLEGWFAQVEKKQSILDAIARPAEKTKTWKEYRKIFVTPSRIAKGVDFWRENRQTLERMEAEFGVPAQMVVAIIGVETRYGRHKGNYRVMDALSTLAFDYPRRSPFFTKELKQFLLLAREQGQAPMTLKGSYAGAMGYGQFMPSSYRAYAIDFDGDELIDIWENPVDAIGSVANYFVRHGWKKNAPVVSRVRPEKGYDQSLLNASLKPKYTVAELKQKGFTPLAEYADESMATAMKLQGEHGAEFWLGLNNFYAITRYNHSRLYAMAVYQLSDELRQAFELEKEH